MPTRAVADGPAIDVLGALTATVGGRVVDLGGRQQRAVLGLLLVARGAVVTTDRLADLLWAGGPPPRAAATIQAYVSHLRRRLEPGRSARSPGTVIVSAGGGYALRVGEEAVDAWRFERLARQAGRGTDPAEQARVAADALALWHGPAFADFTGAGWADLEASRLAELREVVRERALAARLDAGESAVLVPEIEALVTEAPLREERWRLLVLALYRSHRQGDALAALRRARGVLTDELGVEPGPALRTLERAVLTQASTLEVTAARPAEATGVPADVDLVDRDREVAGLRGCLDEARAGRARVVLVEGPAGIGKSRLLAEARRLAAAAGAHILSARSSRLEREFGFGVVRQLFEAAVDHGDAPLSGAAGPARAVFEPPAVEAPAPVDRSFAVLHGLYRLTVNLAARRLLVLTVDDLHWCDAGSLRFLAYLARRLDGLGVLVIASLRTGEPAADPAPVAELAQDPAALMIRPAPLSAGGVATLVRRQFGAAPDAFVAACREATSGNPLLVSLLLRALDADGLRPDTANAAAVAKVGSRALSSLVLSWLDRLPEPAAEVSTAIAVLGDGALLPDVATLAGLPEPATASAIAALSRAGMLRGEYPLGFVHPLVGDAVYRRAAPVERGLRHERAAQVLGTRGAAPEQVAAHLLHAPPRGDGRAVDVLLEAAGTAARRGATDAAATYLRRALDEPPPEPRRLHLLVRLGLVEARRDGRAAVRSLREAYDTMPAGADRAGVARTLAQTLAFTGDRGEATTFARRARAGTPAVLSDERQALHALERLSGSFHGIDPKLWRAGAAPRVVGEGPGARMLAATLASEAMLDGTDRAACVAHARFALAGDVLPRADPGLFWTVAGFAQELADEEIGAFWEDTLADAYRRGSVFSMMAARLWLGHRQWRRGDLLDAYLSLSIAREQGEAWGSGTLPVRYAEAFTVGVLLDRGAVAEARTHLDRFGARPRLGGGAMLGTHAEARLLVAEGRPGDALSCLDSLRSAQTGIANPAWNIGRRIRAQALAGTGRHAEAIAAAEEDLRLARRWGAPSVVGRSLLLLAGLLREGDAGRARELLRQAVATLARSPARLEYARALLDGARAAVGPDATGALLQAYGIARDCAAEGVRAEVTAELDRRGAAVPTDAGAAVLGATERRIVSLLAGGSEFREIAQQMLTTPRLVRGTVEALCARVGVRSLEELRGALANAP